ncbi:MAG TPA: hypothetical protein PLB52_02495 [Candidatus Moranbacteria bacterium]|nr:hypothetical protein [Candidatus Moranbacteria bacterium]
MRKKPIRKTFKLGNTRPLDFSDCCRVLEKLIDNCSPGINELKEISSNLRDILSQINNYDGKATESQIKEIRKLLRELKKCQSTIKDLLLMSGHYLYMENLLS